MRRITVVGAVLALALMPPASADAAVASATGMSVVRDTPAREGRFAIDNDGSTTVRAWTIDRGHPPRPQLHRRQDGHRSRAAAHRPAHEGPSRWPRPEQQPGESSSPTTGSAPTGATTSGCSTSRPTTASCCPTASTPAGTRSMRPFPETGSCSRGTPGRATPKGATSASSSPTSTAATPASSRTLQ